MSSLKEDIEEYMGIPYEGVVRHVVELKGDSELRRKVWSSLYPEGLTKNDLWAYHMSDQYSAYLFWLAASRENEPGMPQVLANVIDRYITQPRILDYGCGTGLISLALRNMEFEDITLADMPHKYNGFLKFIDEKYKLGFKFIPIEPWNEFPLERKYDFIICNEVLEYVWEPEATLLHLYEHLEAQGYMYLSPFFNNSRDPPHLKKNDIYQDTEKWLAMVEGMGLKKAYQDEDKVWKIFQKI